MVQLLDVKYLMFSPIYAFFIMIFKVGKVWSSQLIKYFQGLTCQVVEVSAVRTRLELQSSRAWKVEVSHDQIESKHEQIFA